MQTKFTLVFQRYFQDRPLIGGYYLLFDYYQAVRGEKVKKDLIITWLE